MEKESPKTLETLLPLEVVDLVKRKPEVATLLLMKLATSLSERLNLPLEIDEVALIIYNFLDTMDSTDTDQFFNEGEIN